MPKEGKSKRKLAKDAAESAAKLADEARSAKTAIKAVNKAMATPKSELRGRDLVYIDTDDDVTSIVSRVKNSKDTVVALVPPKRIGVLQSVVNLKLINKAAQNARKKLVIVTTDSSLVNLASGLSIPIAKNINAQAKVPEKVDEEAVSDIIEGKQNDLVAKEPAKAEDDEISAAVAAIENDDKINNDLDANGIPDDEEEEEEEERRKKARKPKKAKKSSAPDASSLRKKVLIIGGILLVLVIFCVWAFVLAPSEVISISTKTSPVDVSRNLSLVPSGDKDEQNWVLSPVIKRTKSNTSTTFTPTGTKEVGEKAKGTVAFCLKEEPYDGQDGTKNSVNIPAGTYLYANGVQFKTDASTTVEGGLDSDDKCETYFKVKATAVNIGDAGNIATNTLMSVSGYSNVQAVADGKFTGGDKHTVKIVEQSDVDSAIAKLKDDVDADSAKDKLKSEMSGNTLVIDSSFSTSTGEPSLSTQVGQETDGTVKASIEITYTLIGVDKDDLSKALDYQLKNQINTDKQKAYSNGISDVNFSSFTESGDGYRVLVKTSGQVGPIINEDDVKEQAKGKKSEEIKAALKETDGVEDVSVRMSPFWVSSISDTNKIKVKFTVNE